MFRRVSSFTFAIRHPPSAIRRPPSDQDLYRKPEKCKKQRWWGRAATWEEESQQSEVEELEEKEEEEGNEDEEEVQYNNNFLMRLIQTYCLGRPGKTIVDCHMSTRIWKEFWLQSRKPIYGCGPKGPLNIFLTKTDGWMDIAMTLPWQTNAVELVKIICRNSYNN